MPRALILLTAVLIAGCAGSSSPKPAASTTTTTATMQSSTAAKPAAKPAAGATGAVSINDFTFTPATLKVRVGAKVTWKNADQTNHNVTFSGAGAPTSDDNLDQGASVTRAFTKAGSFSYVCTFHPGMKGSVVVSK